jgi:hypothetical protein
MLLNKVKINLNMFGALMLSWVGGHVDVDNTNVVIIHQGGRVRRGVEPTQKLAFGGPGDEISLRKTA